MGTTCHSSGIDFMPATQAQQARRYVYVGGSLGEDAGGLGEDAGGLEGSSMPLLSMSWPGSGWLTLVLAASILLLFLTQQLMNQVVSV